MPFETFQKMVKYFYDGNLTELTLVDCGWILSMSDYYLLEDNNLLEYCQHLIDSSDINDSNCFEVLKLALDIKNEDLRERSLTALPTIFDTHYIFAFFISLYDTQQDTIERLEASVHNQNIKMMKQQEEIHVLKEQVEKILRIVGKNEEKK